MSRQHQKARMQTRMAKRRKRILKAEHFRRWVRSLPHRGAMQAMALNGIQVAKERAITGEDEAKKKLELAIIKAKMLAEWAKAIKIMATPTDTMDTL